MALGFFYDAALTSAVTANLEVPQESDGSTGDVDFQLWLGDPDSSFQYQADSDPGTDQITISFVDSDPGNGHETTELKVATTQAGLDTATAGASLNIGLTLLSGASNAQELWFRVNDATATVGTDTTLSAQPNELQKTSV